MSSESIRNKKYSWRELLRMITAHRRELYAANIIAVLGALVSVPVPLLIPILVDEVLLDQPGFAVATMNQWFPANWHGPFLYISAVLVLTLMLRFLALIFNVWQVREFTCISKQMIYQMRSDLLQRLRRISMAEYEVLGSSTVASHLVTDLDAIDEFVSHSTSKFVVALLSVIGTAIVLMWMHWQLALFILLLNPVVIYLTTVLGRRVKRLKAKENNAYQLFQESLAETLDAIQEIRANNRERHYIQRVIQSAEEIRRYSTSYTWRSDAANRLSFVVFLFGFDIFRAVSMLMVIYSDLSIGQMLAVFAYLWYMMGPVQELLGIQYSYHSAKAALQRINRLFDIHLEPEYPTLSNPFKDKRTTSVEISHVCFRYGDGPLVLNNVNLGIAAGEKVALVGASGGGKSTLIQIILGLYPPISGSVLFDGIAVEKIGLDIVRDNVATVLQHPALFNDTVRMNLTLGRNYPDTQLWDALKVAQLDGIVRQLGQQLDTLIGRDGIRLSGGQRQRLAIARMVLGEPAIVILDEATSALDTATERDLHAALNTFLEGRTTLIIAHRLSAVRQADRTLVFEDGSIVEQGTHDDLIRNNGLYASLYRQQDSP